MKPTNGKTPRIAGPFMVQFRGGVVSGPFTREQLRWTDEGSEWCIIGAERAAVGQDARTHRPANGSYA